MTSKCPFQPKPFYDSMAGCDGRVSIPYLRSISDTYSAKQSLSPLDLSPVFRSPPPVHGDFAFSAGTFVFLGPSKVSWCCRTLESAHSIPTSPFSRLLPAKLLPGLS